MKKIVIISLVLVFIVIAIIAAIFVPIKTVYTGGSCMDGSLSTRRHNLILGDPLPQSENINSNGEGCAQLVKHELYLL